MRQAVLISIKPTWCEKIASGEKTIEVRKTRPKLETPFTCYIYETKGYERVGNDNLNCVIGGKGRGMVIGEFVCNNIFTVYYDSYLRYGIDYPNEYEKAIMEKSNLTLWEMLDYLNGKDGYAWVISDLKIYDEPKPITMFLRPCRNEGPCAFCKYAEIIPDEVLDCMNRVERPPQSWCYVDV